MNCNLFYLTSKSNIRYLTGFSGSRASALLTPKTLYLFTDSRYFEEAHKNARLFGAFLPKKRPPEQTQAWNRLKALGYSPTLKIVPFEKNGAHPIPLYIRKHGIRNLSCEENHLTYGGYLKLKKLLPGVKLTPQSGLIEKLRSIKEPEEITLIQKAQEFTEKVFLTLKKTIRAGDTEQEIANRIQFLGMEMGAEGMSFDPIVAFGENASVPHHEPSNRSLKKGDLILIDMGMKFHGYHADMTRTLFTSKPTTFQEKIYETVRTAHEKAVKSLKIGQKAGKIAEEAQKFCKSKGYGKAVLHALGHGVGLEIHESPSLSEKIGDAENSDTLEENMLVTIEPGLYFPNKFGIRLENLYYITKKGAVNFNKISLAIEKNTLLLS